jgi:cobalt-zinc-cadmium efflux system protein
MAAFVVITVFMVVEAVGGYLSGSLALLADAAHMLTDSFALGLAASARFIANRPADARRHFGYRRAQVLAAFVNGILLSGLLIWICVEAVQRFVTPVEVKAVPMLAIAALGLGANAIALRVLHDADRNDLNVRGAMLHVVGDLAGSLAAIIAAIVIIASGWTRIDPLLSLVVAALIARSAFLLVRDASHILLEGAPEGTDVPKLIAGLREAAPEVTDIHDVRIWQITPEHARATLHARIERPEDAEKALERLKTCLDHCYGIRESTVQIEVSCACPDRGDEALARSTQRPRTANGSIRPAQDHVHAHAVGHRHPHAHAPAPAALAPHK